MDPTAWSVQTTFYSFFQAEDGIRDKLVTGVQTCALPISRRWPQAQTHPDARAGFPFTRACGGTSLVTTLPAATKARSPTVTPQTTVAFAPIDAPTRTRVATSSVGNALRGRRSFVKVAFGPTKTSSSSTTRSHTWTPFFTTTPLPMRAPA